MADSTKTFTGDGVTTNFSIDIEYLEQDDITVTVDEVSTSFTFVDSNTIQITPAPVNGAAGVIIRTTDTTRKVDFQDASTITEALLDLNSNQLLYIAQEAIEKVANNMGLDLNDNKWDADNKVIKDAGDPVNAQDVVTLNYMNSFLINGLYLGSKNSDPTTNNDGGSLVEGNLYYNNSSNSIRVYTAAVWTDAISSLSTANSNAAGFALALGG